jgi:hypothetical protein
MPKGAAQTIDYTYWTGRDWSNLTGARDGRGWAELPGDTPTETLRLRIEYVNRAEARIDRELDEVMRHIDPVPFRNTELRVTIKPSATEPSQPKPAPVPEVPAVVSQVQYTEFTEVDVAPYTPRVKQVLAALRTGNHASVRQLFTAEGYDTYTKLLAYGNARVLSEPALQAIRANQQVMCRAVPMAFSFAGNTRKFTENVVFHFNPAMLIEAISFSLNQVATESIAQRTQWNEGNRMVLINFLEHYKTAFALKRLDFIQSIFADDALIITGSVVKVSTAEKL